MKPKLRIVVRIYEKVLNLVTVVAAAAGVNLNSIDANRHAHAWHRCCEIGSLVRLLSKLNMLMSWDSYLDKVHIFIFKETNSDISYVIFYKILEIPRHKVYVITLNHIILQLLGGKYNKNRHDYLSNTVWKLEFYSEKNDSS